MNATTTVYNREGIESEPNAFLEYNIAIGSCVLVGDGVTELPESKWNMNIIDNGLDRQNSWSVVYSKVSKSTLDISVKLPANYADNYTGLTDEEFRQLKFGARIQNTSYTNDFIGKMYKCTLEIASADNAVIAPAVIWANERDWAINLVAGSNDIGEAVQIVPGFTAGIYSEAADISRININKPYIDGNTSLQSVIPTGDGILIKGNIRWSSIEVPRFYIIGKRPITIEGEAIGVSITNTLFDDCDSSDSGVGDIYIEKMTACSLTNLIHKRTNLAAKTGLARTAGTQPPIVINDRINEFDAETVISNVQVDGVNFYSDSIYPAVSAVKTKDVASRIANKNTFECRYTDNSELYCKQVTLADLAALQALPRGEYYSSNLASIGVTDAGDPAGFIEVVRLQSSVDLSVLLYAKITIITENNQRLFVSTEKNGVWSAFKEFQQIV